MLEFCFCAEVTIGWVYSAFLCLCTLEGLLLCVMCVGTWLYVVGRFCVIKYKKRKNDGRSEQGDIRLDVLPSAATSAGAHTHHMLPSDSQSAGDRSRDSLDLSDLEK